MLPVAVAILVGGGGGVGVQLGVVTVVVVVTVAIFVTIAIVVVVVIRGVWQRESLFIGDTRGFGATEAQKGHAEDSEDSEKSCDAAWIPAGSEEKEEGGVQGWIPPQAV